MMIAGIGLKKDAPPEDILMAIDNALRDHGANRSQLNALATHNEKCAEVGLRTVAHDLGIPILPVSQDRLEAVSHRALTNSSLSMATKGVPSVAETAALAAIGENARLLGPRIKSRSATCALATNTPEQHP